MDDLKILKKFDAFYNHKIILFGAGSYGKIISEEIIEMGMQLEAFTDSCVMKWNTTINDNLVVSLFECKKICDKEDVILIISVDWRNGTEASDEILRVIKKYDIKADYLISGWGFFNAVYLNTESRLIPLDVKKKLELKKALYIKENKEHMDLVYNNSSLFTKVMYSDPVIIYQPAKVGSTSLVSSIQRAGIDAIHIHILSKKYVLLKKKIKIITLVRDPIARDISFMFHQLSNPGFAFDLYNMGDFQLDIYEFYRKFIRSAAVKDNRYYFDGKNEFDWFLRDFKQSLGVNIYDYPFDCEKGYTIINQDNVEILAMTLEKMNSLQNVIAQFVGIDKIEIRKENTRSDKGTKYAYEEFLKNLELRDEDFDFYYNDKRFKHFYNLEQQLIFTEKWKNKNL